MSHYFEIFDKFPKFVESRAFFLESSVLLIFDTSTNILAYLTEYRHFRVNKGLDCSHCLWQLGYWATLDGIFNNKKTLIAVITYYLRTTSKIGKT